MEEKDASQFVIVGTGYRVHSPKFKKITIFHRLKTKPIISLIILFVIVLGCIFAGLLANHDPAGFYLAHLNEAPSGEFFFGTDSLGRDIFSMIWYGGRVSSMIGLISMLIIAIIGVVYGCVSGIANSKLDDFMMRAVELMGSIPSLLLVLLITAILGSSSVWVISLVIGITSWFALARIVRSEVRQIRTSEYILVSRCMGASFRRIMLHHLIPNFISSIMFVLVSSISTSMAMESTLSFLGLGLPIDVISWGSMLSLANRALLLNTWWVIVIPGLFLVVTLLCITNIGNFWRKENNKNPSRL